MIKLPLFQFWPLSQPHPQWQSQRQYPGSRVNGLGDSTDLECPPGLLEWGATVGRLVVLVVVVGGMVRDNAL